MSEAILSPHLRELLDQLGENVEKMRELEYQVETFGSGASVPHLQRTHLAGLARACAQQVRRLRDTVIERIDQELGDIDSGDEKDRTIREVKDRLFRKGIAADTNIKDLVEYLDHQSRQRGASRGARIDGPLTEGDGRWPKFKWRGSVTQLSLIVAAMYENYVRVEINAQGRAFDSPPDTFADFVTALASILTVQKVNSDGETVSKDLKYATLKSLRGRKGGRKREVSEDLIRAMGEAGDVIEGGHNTYGEVQEILRRLVGEPGQDLKDDYGIDVD